MILYRPVGLKELELIEAQGFRAFPPRLPYQPIFYPVLNFDYAAQIARDWNTTDPNSGFAGFVTQFEIEDGYVQQFSIKVVGNKNHQELWIPAEDLPTVNEHIVGEITVVASYYGPQFQGEPES